MRLPKMPSPTTYYKYSSIVCLLMFALLAQHHAWLKHWDDLIFDKMLSLHSRPASEDIVIVAIDDYSLHKLGKWPWPRGVHANLINLLSKAEPRVIGLDIIFSEPDGQNPGGDAALVEAVRNSGRVVLPVLPEMNADGRLKITLPWRELAEAAAQIGHVDVEIDGDGLVRSCYLAAGMGEQRWPSFALALFSVNNSGLPVNLKGTRINTASFSPDIWYRDFRIEMPFAGSEAHFSRVSYADVLTDANIRAGLRGKYILVGVTAAGLAPMFATPLQKQAGLISGVEVNAHVLDVLLKDQAVASLNGASSLVLTAMLVLIPLCAYHFVYPRLALSISLLSAVLTLGSSILLFVYFRYWYGPMPVLAALLFGVLLWFWRQLRFYTQSLFKQKQLARATLHSIAEAVITTDAQGLIVYLNPAAEVLTGFSQQTAKGLDINAVVKLINNGDKNSLDGFDDFLHQLRSNQTVRETTPRYIVNEAGRECAVQISASPIKEKSNKISGAVFALNDITETLQISSKISYLATHDPLTGLANRILLRQQMDKAIASCNRHGNFFAVLFIDLDDFKKVNDGMGHAVGDLLLIEVASRLLANIRQIDSVARWGGDEFVVLLNQLPAEDEISNIIVMIFERLSPPYLLEEQTLYVTSSMGISVYPKDGLTVDELLVNADAALYQVKDQGRNNMGFFSGSFQQSAKARLEVEKELYKALDDNQFEVFYQPQVDPKINKIIGAEALLRWNHPDKGLITPDSFIPL
ncbi:MAG: CHASE2 domain-containing protein, partial [Methylomonas sp.]